MAKAGWGERIKARAKELGLSDVAVARALGLAQRRYSAYANESREPDFEMLKMICSVLATTPDAVLGFQQHPKLVESDRDLVQVAAIMMSLGEVDKRRAMAVLETLAQHREG